MLKIHILNVGHGDSIVFELPDGNWGLIDSNVVDGSIPALEFFKKNNINKLSFLGITHPHADHYKGIRKILEYCDGNIDDFWLFTVDSTILSKYLKKLKSISQSRIAKEEFDELFFIIQYIFDKKRSDKLTELVGGIELKTIDSLKIKCIAPLGAVRSEYVSSLASDKMPDPNLISAILHIEYQGVNVLLGGDAPLKSWQDVQRRARRDGRSLNSEATKLSHHGSNDSFSESVWANIAKDKSPAIISVGNRYGLPHKEVIDSLNKSRTPIYCTNKGSYCIKAEMVDYKTIYGDIPYKAYIELDLIDMSQKTTLSKCMGNCTITINENKLTITPEVNYLCPHNIISMTV